ncbi:MAG: hypothetical protein K0T99_02125 [Alphaproteobacteria bacterium]|nr:hypothetical protein [Alphaproteobacteria bacterium]
MTDGVGVERLVCGEEDLFPGDGENIEQLVCEEGELDPSLGSSIDLQGYNTVLSVELFPVQDDGLGLVEFFCECNDTLAGEQ